MYVQKNKKAVVENLYNSQLWGAQSFLNVSRGRWSEYENETLSAFQISSIG
jgi:hypothetical protein